MNIDIISPSSYSEGKIYAISLSTLDLNFTRASTKTRIDENGYIDNVPYNIISYSEEFENSYWTKGAGTTVTPNSINNPYGALTADKIEQTGAAVLLTRGITAVKSGPLTLSCYIKKGNFDSNNNLRFGFFSSGSIGFITYNFLTNQTSVVSGIADKHGVIQEEDGWVRIYITCTLTTAQANNFILYLGGVGSTINTGSFYYLWGAQLNAGSELLPYIKTTTRQNVPSINYINSIPSIQLEPQRTNLLTQSETFTDASWVKLNSLTVSSGTTVSPNGSSNASTLVTANSTSIQGIYKDVSGLLTATRYSFSSFVKKKDYDFAYIKFDNLNGVFANDIVYFNLTGGTVATRDPDIIASVETFRDGWYRIEATRLSLTGGTGRVTLGLASADNTETIAGDGVKGTHVWGAQLEAGPYTSSYIPTISSTATRLADNFSKSNLLSNNLIYSSGGTWFFEVVDNFVYSGNTETLQLILGSNASGTNNSIALSSSANNRYKFVKYQASGKTDLFQTTTDDFKAAVRWNATSFDVFVNGLKVVTGTTFDSSTLEFLNSNMTDVPLNIKNISFSNQYYSDDVLTKATTRQQKLLLDTYPDAAAAFSLRKLKSNYTGPLVKVRRSSDNLEQDIFPTSDGDLDVVALRSFVGTENLLLYSEEINQTNWVKSGSGVGLAPIVTANTAIAPDGTLTADTILLQNTGTTSSDFSLINQSSPVVLGATYTFSVWLKAATSGDIGKKVRLNMATSILITLTDSWQRYSLQNTTIATDIASGIRLRGTEGTDTSVSVHMWGAQLVQGSNVIDYNRTTVGAGGNGFVTTWYDQSGLGNNAVQTTAINQPQIIASGNVLLQNNKPCIIFDDVNDTLRSPVDFATNTSIFSTFRCNDTLGVIYSGTDVGNDYIYAFRVDSGSISGGLTVSQTYKNGNLLTLPNQTSVLNEINTSQVLIWSSLLTNVTLSRFSNLQIGTGVLGATAINWSEIIIYPNNQFSNRINIESNINRYYNVYDDLPAWNKADYSITDSNAFVSYISRNLNKPQVQVTNTFGNFSGNAKWFGGVLAPNAKIYGIPFNSTTVLEFDPITQTTAAFGNLIGSSKWAGGVLAPNGKIYGVPYGSTTVLEIDPITQTTTTFGDLSGSNKWIGGVLAPNGNIYCIPANSTNILVINPNTKTTTLFGTLSSDSNKWFGGVLASNGKIYSAPFASTTILEIDPITQTTATFGTLSGFNKYYGSVLGQNGLIYGIPYDSTAVLEINPLTQTTTTFGNLTGSSKWAGGVLAPNGKIYGIPRGTENILEIDPITKTVNTFANYSTTDKWIGGTVGLNGKIYGIPYNSTTILEILTQPSELSINIPLSRQLNKF